MTFTMMGRCERTGQLGVASATFTVNHARFNIPVHRGLVPGFTPEGTVVVAQALPGLTLGTRILDALMAGNSYREVDESVRSRRSYQASQIGIMRIDGSEWVRTGTAAYATAAHRVGEGHIAMGNALRDEGVAEAMA